MIEEQGGCVSCLSWAHTTLKSSLKEPKNPGPGAASLRCQEREGTGVCDRAHHKMLHGSKFAYMSANLVLGAPRGPVASRSDLFSGKPLGSLLAEGNAAATFEIVEAPVMLEGRGERFLGLCSQTQEATQTSSPIIWPSNYSWKEPIPRSSSKLWTKTKRKRRSKFIG